MASFLKKKKTKSNESLVSQVFLFQLEARHAALPTINDIFEGLN